MHGIEVCQHSFEGSLQQTGHSKINLPGALWLVPV